MQQIWIKIIAFEWEKCTLKFYSGLRMNRGNFRTDLPEGQDCLQSGIGLGIPLGIQGHTHTHTPWHTHTLTQGMGLDLGTGQADLHLYLHRLYPPDALVHSTWEQLTTKKKHTPAFPPVSVGKFFLSFLSACVHNYNLHAPTHASTPLPVPTHMCLSGHAHASCPMPTLAYASLPACACTCPPVPIGKFFLFLSFCLCSWL